MDKIKTVKIKNPDGSISEETYTISVDALNIDMANNKNLQETIGTINIDTDGNIAYQLDNLKNNKVNKTDIIDNLNSAESDKVLSANQGKVLGDAITILNEDVNKKPYYYNSIADMKADTKLKAGDMVITLGYYSANDGGGATYKITDEESESEYQEELDSGLYATIIENKGYINVKTRGIKGDGITDDTSTIQSIINNNIDANKGTTLYFPKGTYLITSTINVPILCTSIIGDKGTTFISNSTNEYGILHLSGAYNSTSGKGGCVIKDIEFKNSLELKDNTLGIYIGNPSQNSSYPGALFTLENCRFNLFDKGIISGNDAYIYSLNNCSSYGCNTFFETKNNALNSGENININKCLFNNFDLCFNILHDNFQMNVIETSFDQGNKVLNYNTPGSQYESNQIVFDKCHFENNLTGALVTIQNTSGGNKVIISNSTTFISSTHSSLIDILNSSSTVEFINNSLSFFNNIPTYIGNNIRTHCKNNTYTGFILPNPNDNLFMSINKATIDGNNNQLYANQSYEQDIFCLNRDGSVNSTSLHYMSGSSTTLSIDGDNLTPNNNKSFKLTTNTSALFSFLYLTKIKQDLSNTKIMYQLKYKMSVTNIGKLRVNASYFDGNTIKNISDVYSEIDTSTIDPNTWYTLNIPINNKIQNNMRLIGLTFYNINPANISTVINIGDVIMTTI